jgi:hypothetical protein
MTEEFITILQISTVAVGILSYIFESQAFKILKRNHSKIYKELGEPKFFFKKSKVNGYRALKFLYKREHSNLNEKRFSLLCDFILILDLILIILILIIFSILIYSLFL